MQMVVSGKIRQGGWDGEGSNGRKADTLLLKERGVEELKTGRGEGGRKRFLHFISDECRHHEIIIIFESQKVRMPDGH